MFIWTDFSNLSADTKVEVTETSVNSWLKRIGSSYYPFTEDNSSVMLSDFPYFLKKEFSDSLIIVTFGDDLSPTRVVAFGEFAYTEEGSLETANFSSWYEMGFSKGVMNDDTGLREDILSGSSNTYSGLSITDINDVWQLVFIDRFLTIVRNMNHMKIMHSKVMNPFPIRDWEKKG